MIPMRVLLFTSLAACFALSLAAQDKPEAAKPTSRTTRQIEGWTVHIDDRLTVRPEEALGQRAIALVTARLRAIKLVVPAARVVELQRIAIVLDLTHGSLTSMQYHPSAGWL